MGCCVTKQVVIVDDFFSDLKDDSKPDSEHSARVTRTSKEFLLQKEVKDSLTRTTPQHHCTLSKQDSLNLQFLSSVTYFNEQEVLVLKKLFQRVGSLSNEETITKAEFCAAVFNDSNGSIFADRIFQLFDKRSLGQISFDEFVYALNVFHPQAPLLEKARFAFQLYDIDNTGHIRPEEIKCFLLALFKDNTLFVPETVIDQIIINTIKEMDINKSGTITLKEWFSSVQKKPSLISYMTLPTLRELALESRPPSMHAITTEA